MNGILLDENLPSALALPTLLRVQHVYDWAHSISDSLVWDRCRIEGLIIVSKDADFLDRALVSQPPPWIVHVRLGNLRLRDFQATMIKYWPLIEPEFPRAKVVSLFSDRIEVIR